MQKVSFQLYSARNYPPLSDVLTMLANHGFQEVEGFGGIYGALDAAGNASLKALLDQNGLTMPTGHFSLEALETNIDGVLALASTMKMDSIFCPFIMPDDRPVDGAGWQQFGGRLQKAGAPYRAAGFDFGWHNHDFEFFATPDGSLPIDRIFDGGPDLSWEMDVAWVVRGGADPFAWIEKYKDRITAVHVKDIAPTGENSDEDGWADVGYGTIDWKGLMAALKATKAGHFIVEHDNPSDLERLISRSIKSIQSY